MRRASFFLTLLLPVLGCEPATDAVDTSPTDVAPGLTLEAPREGAIYTSGEAVVVSGSVSDDRDAAADLVLTLSSSLDGALDAPIVGDNGAFSGVVTPSAGSHALTVAVTDSAGNTVSAEVRITVEGDPDDLPPTAPQIYVAPTGAMSFDALSVGFTAPGADPEGAPVSYTYAWTLDGAAAGDTSTIDGAGVFRGQVWDVVVTPNDGAQDGPAASASITIANAPPTATGVYIGPYDATIADDLVCTVSDAEDREDDALVTTFAWTIEGVAAGDGTDRLAAGTAQDGEEVICSVTLDDGYDTATFTSFVFSLGNSEPGSPTVEITPTSPADTDDLECGSSEAFDPDGDTLEYTWSWEVDGVAVATTDYQVAAEDTHWGEVWTCTVTVTDPGGLSSSGSASVTIGRGWEDEVSASDAAITIDGTEVDGAFGKTIALLGDTDGDGLSELAVGASGENGDDGAVYLFASADLTASLTAADAAASWDGAWTEGQLGGFRSLAAPGDLDGDGAAELMFAAADADANGLGSGEVYLVYGGGSPGLDADPSDADWTITATAGDQVGARMAAADLDADGLPDLLVAAPGASDGANTVGLVGLFYGDGARSSGGATVLDADWIVYGDAENDGLGWTTKGVGDVDGDGYEDAVVGAMYADPTGSESGQLGLLLGGARRAGDDGLTAAAAVIFSGAAAGDRLGYDALGGVDLDEDGVGDLVVAAYQADTGATDAGAVYTFLGSSAWASALVPADADATIVGSTASARFGHVMSAPGDLDSDGTIDVVIGALFDSPTGLAYQGAAYVLLAPDWASAAADTDVPWRAYGEAANDMFGDALAAGRGDVDGDGRDELLVGAQGHDAGGSGAGRIYLWWGR